MKHFNFEFFKFIKMFFKSVVLLIVAISAAAERSNSALPSELTGKARDDIYKYTNALVRVALVKECTEGTEGVEGEEEKEYEVILSYPREINVNGRTMIIIGASAVTETRALAPMKPHFMKYHNDQDGYRIITDYSNVKVWIGNKPEQNNEPEAVCDVTDIFIESDYRTGNIEPELAVIRFECISVTFVIDKVLFPHVNYISPSPIPNFKNAAILGWGKRGSELFLDYIEFYSDVNYSNVMVESTIENVDTSYLGGFLTYTGNMVAIAVGQVTIKNITNGKFASYLRFANINSRTYVVNLSKKQRNRIESNDHQGRNKCLKSGRRSFTKPGPST